ncbi:hypothetical protein [Cohnella abietis]|uniref:Uncharacterized protein n=1 Tax=Cohnella abietis TaxID=2507935 RepID=A0A3T1D2N9_9BACL|nr:hypothetical protein [Cohnella abietis]BBI32376.1 hypothetical protein KCTCHS21_17750 [Cohnella abietis]
MAETARERMVRGYANAIYLDGTRRFETIVASYDTDVKIYAGTKFTLPQIDAALATERITEGEYLETLRYTPGSA